MYNSLTFYYSNTTLEDRANARCLPLNVPDQLQTSHGWLQIEHGQHQQWASNLMHDYETTYCYDVHSLLDRTSTPNSLDPIYVEFTPILLMSSKLVYSQLTSFPIRVMFPGLNLDFMGSARVLPFEWLQLLHLSAEAFDRTPEVLHQTLTRFVAWFKFSKMYLSFYVHKVHLEEDGQVSETFSNGLLCHWLRKRSFGSEIKRLHSPYMEPTHNEVRNHLKRLKEHINRMKTVSQAALIVELNSFIHFWVSAWDLNIRWSTLTYCEDRLRRLLQRWAKRRHPNKGWGWVCHKYWRVGPTAAKCIFWLGLLSHDSSQRGPVIRSTFKAKLVNLIQMRLCESISEGNFLTKWQFFCMDSREGLLPYTVMSFKQWRKSRSFDHFLLY